MGRKSDMPKEHWLVVKHIQTGVYIVFYKNERPDITKQIGRQYEYIAEFQFKEDAERFREFMALPLRVDALAYLRYEHLTIRSPEMTAAMIEQLNADLESSDDVDAPASTSIFSKMVSGIQKETGRVCFGECHSLDGAPACYLCYTERPSTWSLCAVTKCFKSHADTANAGE